MTTVTMSITEWSLAALILSHAGRHMEAAQIRAAIDTAPDGQPLRLKIAKDARGLLDI